MESNLLTFKVIKKKGFVNLSTMNVEEKELSWKAKGLFLYLISRPPNWTIRVTDLVRRSTDGKASLYSGLKELSDKNYIHKRPIHEKGKIKVWKYYVFEEPVENIEPFLLTDFQEIENQEIENRDTYYTTSFNSQQSDKSVSKETPRPNELGRNKTLLPLKIKKRKKKKTNNNGLLYDSLAKPTSRADLSKWFTHNINKHDDREKAIYEFQSELLAKKISPATHQIKEVLDYWNKTAAEMRNNGHKLPVHQIKDTKNIYMCQLIITGILHTSGLTVGDIKKAIDNYSWILENSPWYNKIYPFPKFFSNKKLFDDCVTGYVKDNSRYVNSKRKPSTGGLLEGVKRLHKKTHGYDPSEDDVKMYRYWIREGRIKTEKDFAGYVN